MKQNHLGVSRLSLESTSAITLLHNRQYSASDNEIGGDRCLPFSSK
ncbi:hypothetical protein [Nostoc sp.]